MSDEQRLALWCTVTICFVFVTLFVCITYHNTAATKMYTEHCYHYSNRTDTWYKANCPETVAP